MSPPSKSDAVFVYRAPLQAHNRLPVMQIVSADDFTLAPITIAVGDNDAADNLDTGVSAFQAAAENNQVLVGFDINIKAIALPGIGK